VSEYRELQKSIDYAVVKHYLELDAYGNFVNEVKTDEDLASFIPAAFGVTLPSKVVTEGHQSPFQFIADLFFERVDNALGFANRNGSKTFSIAILTLAVV